MAKTNYVIKDLKQVNVRDIACDILDMFENLLDVYSIDIPDPEKDRENDGDNEAHLYGDCYTTMEDAITNLLSDVVEDINDVKEPMISADSYQGSMDGMTCYYSFGNLKLFKALENSKKEEERK